MNSTFPIQDFADFKTCLTQAHDDKVVFVHLGERRSMVDGTMEFICRKRYSVRFMYELQQGGRKGIKVRTWHSILIQKYLVFTTHILRGPEVDRKWTESGKPGIYKRSFIKVKRF